MGLSFRKLKSFTVSHPANRSIFEVVASLIVRWPVCTTLAGWTPSCT